MIDTGHADAVLVHGVLSYLACNLDVMDPRKARSIGIRPEQAQRITELTASEFMRLASSGIHCLKFEVDSDALDELMQQVDADSERASLRLECVRLGASREMMAEFFGIKRREFARMRQSVGLDPNYGRPRDCSLDDAERIFAAWEKRGCSRDPGALLDMARELDTSLRTIWDEITQYEVEARPHPEAPRHAGQRSV